MFKTIVLALDGSEAAERGVPIAIELAKVGDSKIVIAHVEERMATKGRAPLEVDEDEIQAELRAMVKDFAAE